MSERKAIETEAAPAALGPYSQALLVGDTLYVSGQLGMTPAGGKPVDGGTAPQTRQALENVKAILNAAGMEMRDVVKVQAFLTDLGDFGTFNEVYQTFFETPYPARAAVQVGDLPAGAAVEIVVTAVKS